MQKFGLVIAIGRELTGVLTAFGRVETKYDGAFDVYKVSRKNAVIYVAASGAGEVAAASATQYLISEFKVQTILNFGFVGALNRGLKCQQVVIVKDVVHYDFDTSLVDNVPVGRYLEYPDVEIPLDARLVERAEKAFPDLKTVRLASGDKFIAQSEKKDWLIKTFKADICDMEGAGIVLTANRNKVPALSIKVISDNADETSPVSFTEIAGRGTADCANILTELVDELVVK